MSVLRMPSLAEMDNPYASNFRMHCHRMFRAV